MVWMMWGRMWRNFLFIWDKLVLTSTLVVYKKVQKRFVNHNGVTPRNFQPVDESVDIHIPIRADLTAKGIVAVLTEINVNDAESLLSALSYVNESLRPAARIYTRRRVRVSR